MRMFSLTLERKKVVILAYPHYASKHPLTQRLLFTSKPMWSSLLFLVLQVRLPSPTSYVLGVVIFGIELYTLK